MPFEEESIGDRLPGSLLAAHPSLLDPNFQKTVILISAHSEEDGTLGVVVNRPLEKTLGEFDSEFSFSALAEVPLYEGGPVSKNELLLVAWQWSDTEEAFRLYFGISEEKAMEMKEQDPQLQIRGFLGYAGWSKGQLAMEAEQNAWLFCANVKALQEPEGAMWRTLIAQTQPDLLFLVDVPEDPSRN